MSEVTTIITGVILFLSFAPFLQWLIKRVQYCQIINRIPGRKAYPLIGTMWEFIGSKRSELFYLIDKRTKEFPDIHRVWTGTRAEVRFSKAEYAEQVLSTSVHIEKSFMYIFMQSWLGEGLLTAKNERWHKHRKIITPTFHFNILDSFCEVFAENSETLTKRLEKHCEDGKPFDVYPYVTKAALDIICETAMGTKVNAQVDVENEYVKATYDISEFLMERQVRPWLHYDFIFKRTEIGKKYQEAIDTVHRFSEKVIQERKLARNEKKLEGNKNNQMENEFGLKRRLAFLDLLLEGNEKSTQLTDDDIRQEVDTFMFEGHDTTSAGISWTLFLLGLNNEIQEKVAAEFDTIFQGSDRPATIKDLNEMKYLERCIKESLRLYPSVSFIGRISGEQMDVGGYEIPKGTTVGIHIYHIHRDERFFPDAEKFDPDRFLPENIESRHPYAYIPFSAGPRNCIGQKFALLEEKGVLSTILRKYKIKSVNTRDEVPILHELISRPKGGIKLILEKRK